ncbi:MAG: bifunctional 5,10-methylenetetrahydrofolate dehydrogenase/5,10-methenyltetrahydrofolate cyclohydrolase, partial [Treponema sp.]|nr:bifunctional 5,10-methylenetetrahydrofolate dehydrogenase/5,10-methenyltetrahydrofolate cyclohydrolase [Treponema sp.]
MPAIVIEGKTLAAGVREQARQRAAELKARGRIPCLAVILCGEDPASLSYVAGKEKALAEAGMASLDFRLPAEVGQTELLALIDDLNRRTEVHGILLQLPLPPHLNSDIATAAIAPAKDVDGFHPISVGNLVLGRPGFVPCTPQGVLFILREIAKLDGAPALEGSHAVVVGRSDIVGKPLAALLARRDANATVTVCHTGTRELARHTLRADILIAAVGRPGLITAAMVKPGAAVIDVGVNRVPDPGRASGHRLVGDVAFGEVREKAG